MGTMTILSVEVLSTEAATNLRRHARRERREQKKRLKTMTSRVVANLFRSDFSAFRAGLLQNGAPEISTLLALPIDHLNDSEGPEVAALLCAQASSGRPVLVEFPCEPSKAFEERLRFAAKCGKLKLHFYRLTGRWTILEVDRPWTTGKSDSNCLKDLGVG
jgi:hypothetical protein